MTTPKYKESGHAKAVRLNLSKPHIFFCSELGEWIYSYKFFSQTAYNFCHAQDARWTPRSIK